MGFIDKFKDFMGVGEDEFDDDFEENEGAESSEEFTDFTMPQEPTRSTKDWEEKAPVKEKKDNKVVNIHATTQLQVVLVKPEKFEDASSIADHLLAKRTVVLNLESTNREISRRLVDFLSGVAYANGGQIKKVANSTYIITPYNVGVMGDSLLDELENSGLYL